jgi:hypothetical protein
MCCGMNRRLKAQAIAPLATQGSYAAVHTGEAPQLHQQRQVVLAAAYAAHRERFVCGLPQPPALPAVVWLNPQPPEEKAKADTAQPP